MTADQPADPVAPCGYPGCGKPESDPIHPIRGQRAKTPDKHWFEGFRPGLAPAPQVEPHYRPYNAGFADASGTGYFGEESAPQPEPLRAALLNHYVTAVECDHETKMDTVRCSCSVWTGTPQPSVGAAIRQWIEHVLATLQAPQPESPVLSFAALDDMPGALHYALGHMSDECDCDRIWADIRRFHELQPDPIPAYSALQAAPQVEPEWGDEPTDGAMRVERASSPSAEPLRAALELLRELVDRMPGAILPRDTADALAAARAFLRESGAVPASGEGAE